MSNFSLYLVLLTIRKIYTAAAVKLLYSWIGILFGLGGWRMETARTIFTGLNYFVDILASIGAILGGLLICSRKFRIWFGKLVKDSTEIKKLTEQIKKIDEKVDKIDKKVENITGDVKHIKDKLNQNDTATILTLKYEILDICNRAKKHNGIVSSDKETLCELYHEYVEVWH